MAKKKPAALPAPRFPGVRFFLDADVEDEELLAQCIQVEGGETTTLVDDTLDVFIFALRGRKKPAARRTAGALVKKGAQIELMSENDFFMRLLPDRDHALAMLRAGGEWVDRWRRLWNYWNNATTTLDFNQLDFRKHNLSGCNFCAATFHGAKFQGADLAGCCLRALKDNRFDNARLAGASFSEATRCSFKKADLTRAHINPAEFSDCDFTGAVLKDLSGSYSNMKRCVFRKADFTGARIDESKLQHLDFTGANFTSADLTGCDLTGATLTGATLAGANLTRAKLNQADLSKADLTGAILVKANLSGAKVKGANFKDTTLTGVNLTGVDTASATALNPAEAAKGGKAGANMQQLQQVLEQSQRLKTEAMIELDGKHMVVGVDCTPHRCSTIIRESTSGFYGHSGSLRQGMLQVASKYVRGTLRPETVAAKCVKGPLKSKQLKQLAIRAWCEVMGIEPLEPAAIDAHLKQYKLDAAARRDEWFAVLKTGAAGIEKWSKWVAPAQDTGYGRDGQGYIEHLLRAGPFRRADFAGVNLDRVNFNFLNFDGADFTQASLQNAWLGDYASFRKASFAGAGMQGARCGIGRFSGADFTGAHLTDAHLRVCTFMNCSFQNANLQGADFSYANVRGADFSGANLRNTVWEVTTYDANTVWPTGFNPPPQ